MATRLQNLFEATFQTAPPTVDREAGIIRSVKILGQTSRNGRQYSPQALRDAAALYENIAVNTNHPSRATPNASRTIEEGVGWLENVTVKPDGVYGDLHVIKSHAMANTLFEVAERKPDRFGLSHNASGDVAQVGGKSLVESIKSVRSVDLVQNPATVSSLFESEDPLATKTMTFKTVIESLPAKSRDRQGLTTLLEMDALPMVTADMPVDVAAAGPAPTADEAARAAFEAAMVAILRDNSITWDETKTKIIELVKTLAKMSGDTTPASDTPADTPADTSTGSPAPDQPVTESLQEQFDALKRELAEEKATNAARELLESHEIKVHPHRVATLKAITDAKSRKPLLEEWKKADGPAPKPPVPRPATSRPAPLLEGADPAPGVKPAKGAEAMIAAYR